ncbi:MAG: hypothetical protein CL702_08265 [Chloroflexi bacterium]|jgi:uncharacterized protein (DUF1501 family)|nr:hypothetical protein [Chloroflexota bacterium]MCH2505084.1 DUF1501 domain-containing protein [Dehalococcoidia bacterium]MCS5657984.1 DUF1501 domain-containing protein [Dehalococcoidia bacterium]MED5568226.1 DUF1501 domain-containing protein [Chloroflexota bacterium]MEE3004788.1 DUF1501 domain-containing protein [Chloroflexota bacterium]|tara:strand:+ start:80 stop:1210 length:1131 start_codon:yes stop_codon:yes gene_type:complete
MTASKKDPVLVVLQLTGGNDYLNTVIPYSNPLYRDNRPVVNVPEGKELQLDDKAAFHPEMAPIKNLYDKGQVAVIHGVGYPDSPRSHFRSMDIWHTCEPDKLGTEGWLGRATKDIDPNKENVLTTVSFGAALFRALVMPGVPVACVDDLDSYGLLPGITEQAQRTKILSRFERLYSPVMGSSAVMDYMGQTGLDTLEGADILKEAPKMYSSTIEYPDTSIAAKLKGISQIHQAGFGTRVLYCDHGSFDSHSNQIGMHDKLWKDVSEAVECFFDDLKEHDAADNVVMLMFTEFGRRVHDNGSGTDHGAGGAAFVIGDAVKGGQYSEFPSLEANQLEQGDVVPNHDFRSIYSVLLEDWMGLDAKPIVEGSFEKLPFLG